MSVREGDIRSYFQKTFDTYGQSPKGVDWNGPQGHYQRLGAIVREIDAVEEFSINDVGCGYGSLLNALYGASKKDFDYCGYDLVEAMIEAGRESWTSQNPRLTFIAGGTDKLEPADYSVASGTFNIKQATSHNEWQAYVLRRLEEMLSVTKRKVIVNFLTAYSDADHMREDLYYPHPCELFEFAMTKTGAAAVKHNYGLYDFTLIINR